MREKDKNERKPALPDKGDPQQAEARTYSLETIMALQKALEGGIPPEETLPTPKSRSQTQIATKRDFRSSLITRVRKSLVKIGRGFDQLLRPAMGFNKRSKQTSARAE